MHRFQGLAERQLLGMTNVKIFAEIHNRSERLDGEVYAAVQVT